MGNYVSLPRQARKQSRKALRTGHPAHTRNERRDPLVEILIDEQPQHKPPPSGSLGWLFPPRTDPRAEFSEARLGFQAPSRFLSGLLLLAKMPIHGIAVIHLGQLTSALPVVY